MASIEAGSVGVEVRTLDEVMGGDSGSVLEAFAKVGYEWAAASALEIRDAIVVVPFAELIRPVRDAWAKVGGWMPRIETSVSLKGALAKMKERGANDLTFDVATDRLTGTALLRSVPALAAMSKDEARVFGGAVKDVVDLAQAVARRAGSLLSSERDDYWEVGRAAFDEGFGVGGIERMLGKVAFEWAAMSSMHDDGGFEELSMSGLIVLKAGGLDAWTTVLVDLCEKRGQMLLVDLDPQNEDLLAQSVSVCDVQIGVCEDFEEEAQATAAQLIQHINAGETPVGLIALDRGLVRRVCALLRREGVSIHDETGWKLSTTRCGSAVMGLLRSAGWKARSNDILDWLKSHDVLGDVVTRSDKAVESLEGSMRRYGWTRPASVVPEMLSEEARVLWSQYLSVVELLGCGSRLALDVWLDRLRVAQQAAGDWQYLSEDRAGVQLIHALRQDNGNGRPREWGEAAKSAKMSYDEFTLFVGDVLEQESFVEAGAPEEKCQVVVTPLRRAMLRQFRATVFPGVDEKRLGGTIKQSRLLNESLVSVLGLSTAESQRVSEGLSFAHAVRMPKLTLLRRRSEGSEPLAASALVRRMEQSYQAVHNSKVPDWVDCRVVREVPAVRQERPSATAVELFPEALTASLIESLRDCPYKFFAVGMLGLREQDELEDAVAKKDYGTWLHATLHRFHLQRAKLESTTYEQDVTMLRRAGSSAAMKMGLDECELVPYMASFDQLVPRYVAWQRDRETRGLQWLGGEIAVEMEVEGWGGTKLRGRLDRIDSDSASTGVSVDVIDYKSGNADVLKQKAKSGAEDTQMAGYAVLAPGGADVAQGGQSDAALMEPRVGGMYLCVDEKTGVVEVPHKEVQESAVTLVRGLGGDISRIKAGESLQALGEGRTCEHCSVRGLCRKDHWQALG